MTNSEMVISVRLKADGSGLVGELRSGGREFDQLGAKAKQTERDFERTGAAIQRVGIGVRGFVAGLAASLATGLSIAGVINEASKAQTEIAQLNAVVRSTGGAAGFSAQQLALMNDQIQRGTFSSGQITEAQIRLLSYSGVVGDVFPRALQTAIDQAERLQMSVTQSAETVGRALETPTKAAAALAQQGFGAAFTDSVKASIEALERSGRMAEAQTIILDILSESYGGAAEAAGQTFAGAKGRLANQMADLIGGNGSGLTGAAQAVDALTESLKTPEARNAIDTLTGAIFRLLEVSVEAMTFGVRFGEAWGSEILIAGLSLVAIAIARMTAAQVVNIATTARGILARQQELAVNAAAEASFARMAQARALEMQQTLAVVQVARAEEIASLNAANAKLRQAQATIAATRATGSAGLATGFLRRAQNDATAATVQRSAALTQLATLSRQQASIELALAAATNASTAANVASAAAASRLSIAGRAGALAMTTLRGAMALVGGPVGALVLGATGVAWWLMRSRDEAAKFGAEKTAIQSMRELADEAHRVRAGGALISPQARETLDNAQSDIRRTAEAMRMVAVRRDELIASGDLVGAATLQRDVDLLMEKIRQLTADIQRYEAATSMASGTNSELGEAVNTQILALQQQLSLMRAGAEASEAADRVRLAGQGLTADEIEQLISLNNVISGITTARQKQAEAERDAQQEALKESERITTLQQEISLTTRQNELMREGRTLDEARFVAAYEGADAQTRALLIQQQVQQGLSDLQRKAADEQKRLADEGRRAVDEFLNTDSFASLGSTLRQAFEEPGAALAGLIDGVQTLAKVQREADEALAKSRANPDLSPQQRAKEEIAIANKIMAANINAYGTMAGAAKNFFKEGSSGYKGLETAEKAFRAAELALAIESLAVKLGLIQAETLAVTASSAVKATASGVAAAASSMVGLPFPANIAALAATLAALAGIGVLISGGGGGGGGYNPSDAARGVGTVLGDPEAASESIGKSLDLLTNLADQQLDISRSQLRALQAIETGLLNTASGIARGIDRSSVEGVQRIDIVAGQTIGGVAQGGLQGQFARDPRTLFELLGNAFGLDVGIRQELDQRLQRGIGDLFTNLVDGVVTSAEVLGLGSVKLRGQLEGLALSFESIDLRGLTGDEITERISAVFSAASDQAITQVLPQITQYQQVNEGLLETLTRLSAQTQIAEGALGDLGIRLGPGLSVDQFIAVTDRLAQSAGGVDQFATNIANLLDVVLTADQSLARQQRQLSSALGSVDLALPSTIEGLRDLVAGLDLLTDAGVEQFTVVSQLSDALGEYYDTLRDITDGVRDLRANLAREIVGLRGGSLAEFDQGQALAALARASDIEERLAAIADLQSAFTATLDEQMQAIEATRQAEIEVLNSQLRVAQEAQRTFERALDVARGLRDIVTGLDRSSFAGTPEQQVATALDQFRSLRGMALAGDADSAQQMGALARELLDLGSDAFASGPAFQSLFNEVKTSLNSVAAGLEIDPRSPEVQSIEALQAAIEAANNSAEFQREFLNNQLINRLASLDTLVSAVATVGGTAAEQLDQLLATGFTPEDFLQIVGGIESALGVSIGELSAQLGISNAAVLSGFGLNIQGLQSALGGDLRNLGSLLSNSILAAAEATSRDEFRQLSNLILNWEQTSGATLAEGVMNLGKSAAELLRIAFGNLPVIDKLSDYFPQFAMGGIATRASIFGEAGPEAAVPLPDGRTIPVTLTGAMFNPQPIVDAIRAADRRAAVDQQQHTQVVIETNKRLLAQVDRLTRRIEDMEANQRLRQRA